MQRRAKKRMILAAALGLAGVVAIVGAIAGIKTMQFATIGAAFAAQVPAPERVNAIAVDTQEWVTNLSSVGSVVAVQGTEVSAEADGVVRAILFTAGSFVEAGDVLVRLDDEVEQSQLRSAEAAAELARLNLERGKQLIARSVVSQADFEQIEATWKQAAAQVDNIRAVIAKKVVRAPFAGRVGIRRISVGEFLAKGAAIVSLQSIDPVYVEFSVPQRHLAALREGQIVTVTADAEPDEHFSGEITALESHVDVATRNVRVQATFDNAHGALRPGMFVVVDVTLGAAEAVNVIPATAVVHAAHGDSVFVIEPAAAPAGTDALIVRQQAVTLGERRGDFVVVEAGPQPGERVVATGVFKLRTGMPVVVDNALAPRFALAPTPDNS